MTCPEINSESRRLLKNFAQSARITLLTLFENVESSASSLNGEAALNSNEYALENAAYSLFMLSVFARYLLLNGFAEGGGEQDILSLIRNYENHVPPAVRGCFDYYGAELRRFSYAANTDTFAMLSENGGFACFIKDLEGIDEGLWLSNPEIIGVLHQYFHAEVKAKAINAYKGRIEKEQIAAATQLFTPAWVVKYLVENSLGKLWANINPASPTLQNCAYYIPSPDGGGEKTDIARAEMLERLLGLTFFDPCTGSGNILLYAFELFSGLYSECGFSAAEAAAKILENNLYGMDLDERMEAVCAFSLLMKAAMYDKGILSRQIRLNFTVIRDSDGLEIPDSLKAILGEELYTKAMSLISDFRFADEAGCLIKPEGFDYADFVLSLEGLSAKEGLSEADIEVIRRLIDLAKQAAALSRKHSVVATNPPYSNKPSKRLKGFLLKKYKAYAGDLFSAVMKRSFDFCEKGGCCAFLTPYVWLFIATHEQLRKDIISSKTLESLLLFEYSAFADATVPLCAFALKNESEDRQTVFIGLDAFRGGMEIQEKYLLDALKAADCPYKYIRDTRSFASLPYSSFAFWADDRLLQAFKLPKRIVDIAAPRQGLATGDNSRYVRYWHEVCFEDIGQNFGSLREFLLSGKKYMPYNKGGSFCRWYGNQDRVLRIDAPYFEELKNRGNRLPSRQLYGRECISWSKVTSGDFSMRYIPQGFAFDVAGCSIFAESDLWCLLAFSNSVVMQSLLHVMSKTLNYEVGAVKSIPYKELSGELKQQAEALAKESVAAAKEEWDRYEQSRDFVCSPLVKLAKKKRNS